MKTQTNRIHPLALALAALIIHLSAAETANAASFLPARSMSTARLNHTATLLPSGKVLVAGGDGSNSAEIYDPATGTWTGTGAMTNSGQTATLLPNGKVLVAGGGGGSAEIYDPATGTWTGTGAMTTERSRYTATLLPNGKVLVAGGLSSGGITNSAELYDPATGTWTGTGGLGTARERHTATLLPNGKVLVAGGTDACDCSLLSSSELYDPAAGTWAPTTGGLVTARRLHTATLLPNGKVLIAGGQVDGNVSASSELYDPTAGTWAPTTGGLSTWRYYHTATLLPNGGVLVAGGIVVGAPDNATDSAELYDPASGTWATTSSLITRRDNHTATLLPNGRVLVAGGTEFGVGFPYPVLDAAELYDSANGAWAATGGMGTAVRYLHTATLLANGTVLAAAGQNSIGTSLTSARLYDPNAGTWATTGTLNDARDSHTATLLSSGKVLVAGGEGNSGSVDSSELYDPATGNWTRSGYLNTYHTFHTATLLPNGKVLVAGGVTASAELYDPATGAWSGTAGLSTTRASHTATLLPDGQVLVAAGHGNSGVTNSAERYNPAIETWTGTGPLITARQYHTATLLPNGKVLVAGGQVNGGSVSASSELFDPATGTWTATAGGLGTARAHHTATLLPNGSVLVAGGEDNGGFALSSAEIYDPGAGTWTATPTTLITARENHTATLLANGKVLVAAGYRNGGVLSAAELYDIGLGFSAAWQPQIATFTSPVLLGGSLTLTGSRFRGVSEGSGGNNSQDSPADYPVVQLRSIESGQTLFLPPTPSANWSATSFTSKPVNGLAPGYTLVTAFVNGIPSASSILPIKATATVTLSNLSQNYDGTAKSVSVTTAPAGLSVAVTYNGSANAPTNIGSYSVVATVNDPSYQGSTSGTLVINDPLTVANLNNGGQGSLRAVIASAPPGSALKFASNLTGTITLTSGELVISNNLTVPGPGTNGITINGNNNSRVFHITGGNVKISGLTLSGGLDLVGGGLYNQSTVTLSNCMVSGNSSYGYGGGGLWNDGTMTVVGCTICSNSAASSGGGGGGIYNNVGFTMGITNSTICANSDPSPGDGAGIFNAGPLIVNSCTIASNSISAAGNGGGIANWSGGNPTLRIENTIVAGNSTMSATNPDVAGVFTSKGFNLIGATNGSSGWTGPGIFGSQLGSLAARLDPGLGPLRDNGGPTLTMGLVPGSRAIDKGLRFSVTTDQRGQLRPYDFTSVDNFPGADGSDIGAFELDVPTLSVALSGGNAVLSWRSNYTGYALETAPSLSPTAWTVVPGTPAIVGNQYVLSAGPATNKQFFRLALTVAGTALNFNGINNYIDVPGFGTNAPATEITVEFWQLVNAVKNQQSFAWSSFNSTNVFAGSVPYGDGNVYWDFGNINTSGRLAYSFPNALLGAWQHWALVASQSNNYMRIYLNGVLVASKTGMTPLPGGNLDLLIGAFVPFGNYFGGQLDEFRIWNVARSQAQIQASMNHSLSVPQANLVAYWRFDEGSGTSAFDSSGQGRTGTLQNAPVWVISTAPLVP